VAEYLAPRARMTWFFEAGGASDDGKKDEACAGRH
jgi:hypothetical protein